MPGELFTRLYVQRGGRLDDDARARLRIGVQFRYDPFVGRLLPLASYVEGTLGVRVEGGGKHAYQWDKSIQNCNIHDLLNLITLVYRFLGGPGGAYSNWWRDTVRTIFAEQNLAYEIDDQCGVHPAVDQEFQINRTSTIAALQAAPRYDNVRASFERVSNELRSVPPNYKEAWRTTFSSVEGLFRLMFPNSPQLSAERIRDQLRPLVNKVYAPDGTAQRAAAKLVSSFEDWVDGSHNYRHEPGVEEPAQPPSDVAILAISHGASLLRWLVGLDQAQQQ